MSLKNYQQLYQRLQQHKKTLSSSVGGYIGATIGGNALTQKRHHHPSPFDPQTTRGWKAAVKVRNVSELELKQWLCYVFVNALFVPSSCSSFSL